MPTVFISNRLVTGWRKKYLNKAPPPGEQTPARVRRQRSAVRALASLGEEDQGCYWTVVRLSRELVYGRYEPQFSAVMIFWIVCAGLLVGLQTYPSLEKRPELLDLDKIVLSFFTLEVVAKIIAEGPQAWRFFFGKDWRWNIFDLVIVLLSMPFIPVSNKATYLLRLIRLARLGKLLKKVDQLRVILSGLVAGLRSIVYIMVLLFLIFYIYGVAGVMFFGANDTFQFRNLQTAFMSLFQVATFDNWFDLYSANQWGCDAYTAGKYVSNSSEWGDYPAMMRCKTPKGGLVVPGIFFVSFILLAIIIVALFIGAITMAMADSTRENPADNSEEVRWRASLAVPPPLTCR
jgi:hypothetical protein